MLSTTYLCGFAALRELSPVIVDSADFDGTNDYMLRGADLSSVVDSKSGILSLWIRLDGGDGVQQRLLGNSAIANAGFYVLRLSTNLFAVVGENAASTIILDLRTTATFVAGATWRHLLASWDLASAGASHLYINDVSDKNELVFTNDTIDYTLGDFGVGAGTAGGAKTNGCLAEVYFAPGQYLNFADSSNRRKFITVEGYPANLGSDGATPTGTAPAVYLHLDDAEAVANFATNRGSGGNFTITGTLDTGSTSPSD